MSTDESDIEPYFHETMRLDDPVPETGAPQPMSQMPCTFESVPAGIITGVFGFVFGAGVCHS